MHTYYYQLLQGSLQQLPFLQSRALRFVPSQKCQSYVPYVQAVIRICCSQAWYKVKLFTLMPPTWHCMSYSNTCLGNKPPVNKYTKKTRSCLIRFPPTFPALSLWLCNFVDYIGPLCRISPSSFSSPTSGHLLRFSSIITCLLSPQHFNSG